STAAAALASPADQAGQRGVEARPPLARITAQRVRELRGLGRPVRCRPVTIHVGDETDMVRADELLGARDRFRRDAEPVGRHQHQRASRGLALVVDECTDQPASPRLIFDSLGRHPASLTHWWSMISPENRYPLFGIMLHSASQTRLNALYGTTSPMHPASNAVKNSRPSGQAQMQRAPAV